MTRIRRPDRSLARRLLVRFHRDERGQLMPLILAMMLAFTTSVVLVINTGNTTNARMNAQHAIDAATVSGGTSLARGMNYICENNVTLAKVTATMAVVEAMHQAIPDGLRTLKIWRIIARIMQASPDSGTRAAGRRLEDEVDREEEILEGIKPGVDEVYEVWVGSGTALAFLRLLTSIGDVLFEVTPLVAQHTTGYVYEANLVQEGEKSAWMIPLYPHLPACRGIWGDLAEKTAEYARRYSRPVLAFGSIVPLSMFSFWYELRLRQTLDAYFNDVPDGEADGEPSEDLKDLRDQLRAVKAKLAELKDRRQELTGRLNALRAQAAALPPDQRADLDAKIAAVKSELAALKSQVADQERKLERLLQLASRRAEDAREDAANKRDVELATPPSDSELHPDIYPIVLDGSRWPSSFTYFGVGLREPRQPLLPPLFDDPKKAGTAFVYAATRVFNRTRADLWTPDWRAKLVRAREEDLQVQGDAPDHLCPGRPGDAEARSLVTRSGVSLPPGDVLEFIWRDLIRDGVNRH